MKTKEIELTVTPDQKNSVSETTPTSLIEMAILNGADVDKLEKLMEMQMKWEANKARKKFFEALSGFQMDVHSIPKSKTVDYTNKAGARTKYSYAPLETISAAIKEPLHKNGITYRWEFQYDTAIKVTCILTHIDGHSESTTMVAGADTTGSKNDIQSRGSTITYLQRYTLIGSLGIGTADEDTDTDEKIPAEDYQIAIDKIMDFDKLMAFCKTHPLKSSDIFRTAVALRVNEIRKGAKHE